MPPPSRRRWRAVAALGVVLAAAGIGAGGDARAQEVPDGADLAEQFGGFSLAGRGNGLQLTYNVENVFPIPAPLFQASVPEATATMGTGPNSTALGSVAYPGNLLANLPGVVEQASPGNGGYIPPYPLRAGASYPSGPYESSQDIGTANTHLTATGAASDVVTTMGGADLPAFVRIGTITTAGHAELLDGQVEARGRAVLSDVDLLFGLIHIDSIVTDLVADTNGQDAASDGGTNVTGATFLGQPITIGPDGVTTGEQTPPTNAGPLSPIVTNLPGLGPVTDAVDQATTPLNQALQQILGTTSGSVNDLLAASGITIKTMEPFESLGTGSAERTANGVMVTIDYNGRGDNPLAQLLALVPSDQLPGEALPGVPLNTSPQALVNLLKETHVTSLALAYANVNVLASPAFEFTPPSFTAPSLGGTTPGGASTPSLGRPTTGGFTTPSPALGAGGGGAGGPTGITSTPAASVAGLYGVAGWLLLALLVGAPLFAVGSTKLADNSLQEASSSCPDGLDGRS